MTAYKFALAIVAPIAVLTILFLCYLWKMKVQQQSHDDIIAIESLQYDICTIKAAVNNFSENNKLGQGGFGDVYKGRLQNGLEMAVKRLSPKSTQGIKEFKTEVLLVAKLQHRNLVRLLGFCVTAKEKLLIYEYMPYSSLDRILFVDPDVKRVSLVWKTRYKIIDGIAKGLLYLHQDSRYKIVHRDLKPSNILLDTDMTPKIADFGMAKLFGDNEVQGRSAKIVGTLGYMAPEYIGSGELSTKSDVYSFGVLVLEIVSGQRIRSRLSNSSKDEEGLLQRARRLWHADEPLALVDSTLCGNFSAEEATRCIHIGLLCVQEQAEERPTMASIVYALSSHSNSLPNMRQDGCSEQDSSIASDGQHQSANTYSGPRSITVLMAR